MRIDNDLGHKLANYVWSIIFISAAITFLVICCSGCSTRKTITETVIVHDTVVSVKYDTIRDIRVITLRDTTRHEVERIVTLKESGDTIRITTNNNVIRYIERSDSINKYRAAIDSLKKAIESNKTKTDVKILRMPNVWGYAFVAGLAFVIAVFFLQWRQK